MNELMIFKNEEFGQIRTVEIEENRICWKRYCEFPWI